MQVTRRSVLRETASKYLAEAAKRLNRPRLAAMAMKVKLDAFVKVKKAIDDMVAELLRQKDEEIKQKDFCVEELNKNVMANQKATFKKEDLETLIKKLQSEIQQATDRINALQEEVDQTIKSMKEASEQMVAQSLSFQKDTQDQKNVQAILENVLNVLKTAYPEEAALVQQEPEPAGPPPPTGFKTYEKQSSSGVTALIERIRDDAKELEAEVQKEYEEAQALYKETIDAGNTLVTENRQSIETTKLERAKLEKDLMAAKNDLEDTLAELVQLGKQNEDLHTSCDFVIKNFDVTQKARDQEVAALRKAKEILSGARFSQFLQQI